MKTITNHCKNNIVGFTSDLILESVDKPNKIKKIKKYPYKKHKPFIRYRMIISQGPKEKRFMKNI